MRLNRFNHAPSLIRMIAADRFRNQTCTGTGGKRKSWSLTTSFAIHVYMAFLYLIESCLKWKVCDCVYVYFACCPDCRFSLAIDRYIDHFVAKYAGAADGGRTVYPYTRKCFRRHIYHHGSAREF